MCTPDGKCNPDPEIAATFHAIAALRVAEIERWGQCEETAYNGKQCRFAKGHGRAHNSGGVSWTMDIDHEGGQAAELERLFNTCKSIIPNIELPDWVKVQADLAHLAYLWKIDTDA